MTKDKVIELIKEGIVASPEYCSQDACQFHFKQFISPYSKKCRLFKNKVLVNNMGMSVRLDECKALLRDD